MVRVFVGGCACACAQIHLCTFLQEFQFPLELTFARENPKGIGANLFWGIPRITSMTRLSSVIVLVALLLRCSAVEEKDGVTVSGIWSRIQLGATKAAGGLSRLFSVPKSDGDENGHCRTEDEGCHKLTTKEADTGAVTKTKQSVVGLFADAFEGVKRKVTTSASHLFESVRKAVRSVFYEELGKLFTPDLSTPGEQFRETLAFTVALPRSVWLYFLCLYLVMIRASLQVVSF